MKKILLLTILSMFLTNIVLAQLPSGARPPQETHTGIGLLDITPNENEVNYDTYVFSPVRKEATIVGSYRDFLTCLNNNLSKNTKEYLKKRREWVILSFVVEKDSTVSDVQVYLSDDPEFSKAQHILCLYSEIEGYPGWGKVVIDTGHHLQIWKSRNKRINKDLTKFIIQTRWIPIKINEKTVRSKRNFHLPINLKNGD